MFTNNSFFYLNISCVSVAIYFPPTKYKSFCLFLNVFDGYLRDREATSDIRNHLWSILCKTECLEN